MNKILGSDEEEDLESLRLAALQSLKRKNAFSDNSTIHYPLNSDMSPHFRGKGSRQKWGRFGSHQRPGKSGHFNRHRNTNLIPITPIGSESDVDPEKTINLPKEGSSDNLKDEQGVAKEDACSKFTRYNKSDKSESESEEDEPTSEDNQPGKLKKSDSLEALMQELDDEIQGKASDVEKPKTKKIKKKRKSSEQGSSEVQPQNEEVNKEIEAPKEDVEEVASSDNKDVSEDTSSVKLSTEKNINRFERKNPFARKHFRSRSPNSRFIPKKRRMFPNMASPPPHMPFNPPNHFGRPIMLPYMNAPCNPLFIPANPSQPPPLYFDRPISPLSINTESLTTATLAPLSPRSARFVLENKAIIERRKRSPRRSYSRSPSRSLSRSPRYSPSPPRRFRRSVSPRRLSRSPRRFSPRKRSLSPRRRSLSPKRDVPANSQPVRAPINRPKPKPDKVEDNKPKEKEVNKIEDETTLDPILLARKKKFETKEIKKKEGIIRLKPKEDKSADAKLETTVKPLDSTLDTATSSTIIETQISKENKILEKPSSSTTKLLPVSKKAKIKSEDSKINDESKATEDPLEFQELERLLLNDDVPIDDPTVQPKVVDIFSDEESDSDNEGRFKMKQKRVNVPPVLSFSKLINGVKQEIKSEALPDYAGAKRDRRDRRSRQTSTKSKVPESSQDHQKEKVHASTVESQYKRQKITFKNEPKHSTENRVEHKIEIKIKNPSKYEKIEKIKNKAEILGEKSKIIHPIEDDDEVDEQQLATEEAYILEKSDSGDDENVIFTEGDLRTQLSRKRAEKLYKIPAEEVSTRILKFALQGAVFKKSKKKSKKKNSNDGKLPIHLRLGINSPKDIFEDIKVKKKSKKRKSREVLEQKAPSKY